MHLEKTLEARRQAFKGSVHCLRNWRKMQRIYSHTSGRILWNVKTC
uniref:Uncharacterized protein n=1 Tax=Arundo donax TaxID=35708 RepID=A0A0A9FSM2_ARUDO